MPASKTVTNPAGVSCTFDETTHTYMTGLTELTSVTKFVKHFFPPFDAAAISARVADRDGKTPEAVLAEWDAKRDAAARLGTRVHEVAEDAVLGRAPRHHPETERERALMAAAWEHVETMRADGWEFVGAEMIVFSEPLRLAGCIDLAARAPGNGGLWLLDWKTNESIDTNAKYGGTGLYPIGVLPDCNHVHYSLQLATYETILRKGGYVGKDELVGSLLLHLTDRGVCPMHVRQDARLYVPAMLVEHLTDPWDLPF